MCVPVYVPVKILVLPRCMFSDVCPVRRSVPLAERRSRNQEMAAPPVPSLEDSLCCSSYHAENYTHKLYISKLSIKQTHSKL